MRRCGLHDRKAELQDPQPACQKLLPQDYHLRKTKLLFRYSVVSADPAGSPFIGALPPTRLIFPVENSTLADPFDGLQALSLGLVLPVACKGN